MWEKEGSPDSLHYSEFKDYVEKLNKEKFAGFFDWRLPTIPELLSLLEPDKQLNGLYINPVFSQSQRKCWSSDTVEGEGEFAWYVNFQIGVVRPPRSHEYFVRVVRNAQVQK